MKLNIVNSGSRPRTLRSSAAPGPAFTVSMEHAHSHRRVHARLKRSEQLVTACLISLGVILFTCPPSSPLNHPYPRRLPNLSIWTDVIVGLALGPKVGAPHSGLPPQSTCRRPGSRDLHTCCMHTLDLDYPGARLYACSHYSLSYISRSGNDMTGKEIHVISGHTYVSPAPAKG